MSSKHYKIDFSKVKTQEDVIRILEAFDITIEPETEASSKLSDLLVLVDKPTYNFKFSESSQDVSNALDQYAVYTHVRYCALSGLDDWRQLAFVAVALGYYADDGNKKS